MGTIRMTHTATYVCDTDTRRSKTFPFSDGQTPPRQIRDEATGDTFSLRAVIYEADTHLDEIDAQQARVRAWNAQHYAGAVRDVIANDTATAYGEDAA